MYDEMDRYLSRCLKNWAARWQPPHHGRQKLLTAAQRHDTPQNPFVQIVLSKDRPVAYGGEVDPLMSALYSNRWLGGSFTLLQAWPLHIAGLVNVNA